MGSIICTFLLLIGLVSSAVISREKYWSRRDKFLHDEEAIAIGGNLDFENGEEKANDILMAYKRAEIDKGQWPLLSRHT